MTISRIFVYNDTPYLRVTPVKALMRSTTIYEAVTRGSFFAVNLQNNQLTILPQGADRGDARTGSKTAP